MDAMNKEFLSGLKIGFWIISPLVLFGLVYFLAKVNLFFTFVEEGMAKAIVKFGKFHRIIISYEGFRLKKDHGLKKSGQINYDFLSWLSNKLGLDGLRWVGIPFIHSVHTYEFRWTSYEQAEEGGKLVQRVVVKKKRIDYILLQDDVYYAFIRAAETKDKVPVDVDILLTIRITNPYKALFRVQSWLEATENQLKPVLRSYIAKKSFSKLIERMDGKTRSADDLLKWPVETSNGKNVSLDFYLDSRYGVRVKKIGFVRIDPIEKHQEIALKKWEAEREAERIGVIANAEADRLQKVVGKIKELGDTGTLIRTLEALEKTGEGQGNTVLFPLGSLKDITKAWTGKEN